MNPDNLERRIQQVRSEIGRWEQELHHLQLEAGLSLTDLHKTYLMKASAVGVFIAKTNAQAAICMELCDRGYLRKLTDHYNNRGPYELTEAGRAEIPFLWMETRTENKEQK